MDIANRPFTCHFCPARFTRNEHKTRHEQAHRPHREYLCQKCRRSFCRKDVLLRHERLVHKASSPPNSSLYSSTISAGDSDSESTAALRPDQQHQNLNKQPDRSYSSDTNIYAGDGGDGGDDNMWEFGDDILPSALDLSDNAGLLQEPRVSNDPKPSNHKLFLPYSTPLPHLTASIDIPILLPQGHFDLDLDVFGPLNSPSDPGRQGSAMSSRSLSLGRLTVSSRLVEKMAWLTRARLRPVPVLVLDDDWIQTSQGRVIQACLPNSLLTLSRNAFQRWIQLYFLFFHPHVALLHTPTFRVSDCHHTLLLCMAAIGAVYSYNRDHAIRLHKAAADSLANHQAEMSATQRMQATLLLAIFDSWSNRPEMHARCFAVLTSLMSALSCSSEHTRSSLYDDWHCWVEIEGFKRTIWFSCWFLSLMYVSGSIAPRISWYQDCTMELPYEESLWICDNPSDWSILRMSKPKPPLFGDAYQALMCDQPIPTTVGAFGLGILMCALFAHVQQAALIAAGPLSDMTRPLFHSCEVAMAKWLAALREIVDDQRTGANDNIAMAEAATAMWNVTMVHLYTDVRLVQTSQYIVSSQRDEHFSRFAGAIPRNPHMSKAMHHAADFIRGPISHGVAFLAQTGCLNLNPCLSHLGIHCIILLVYWLHSLELIASAEARAALTQDELETTETIREVLRESDMTASGDASLLLSELCLRVWSEAMSRKTLAWAFDEQKRHILQPEVLFPRA